MDVEGVVRPVARYELGRGLRSAGLVGSAPCVPAGHAG